MASIETIIRLSARRECFKCKNETACASFHRQNSSAGSVRGGISIASPVVPPPRVNAYVSPLSVISKFDTVPRYRHNVGSIRRRTVMSCRWLISHATVAGVGGPPTQFIACAVSGALQNYAMAPPSVYRSQQPASLPIDHGRAIKRFPDA